MSSSEGPTLAAVGPGPVSPPPGPFSAPPPPSGPFSAPPPPPGPGVQPPFPAPPIEGRRRRVGLGLGLGIGAFVLVAVVGLIALIGFGTVAQSAINEQAEAVVGDYLDAVRDGRYDEAYDMLCQSAQAAQSESQYAQQAAQGRKISDYDVGSVDLTGDLSVPVELSYADGSTGSARAVLDQNTSTGGFEVCSIEE